MKKAFILIALFTFCALPAALYLSIGLLSKRGAPREPIDFHPNAPWKHQ